jgi:hypothetical protein
MSQVNLSGFAVGEDNVYHGSRLQGEERSVALSLLTAQKASRDERLKAYFDTDLERSEVQAVVDATPKNVKEIKLTIKRSPHEQV